VIGVDAAGNAGQVDAASMMLDALVDPIVDEMYDQADAH